MATGIVNRLTSGFAPFLLLLPPLLVSLHWMSTATQNSAQSTRFFSVLLIVNGFGLVLMLGLIGLNIYQLVRQYRTQAAGSRLTARMVGLFAALAVLPVGVVYYYSLQFLHRGIDNWFDVRIEQALDDSLELSRASLDQAMRERFRQTQQMMNALGSVQDGNLAVALGDERAKYGAMELTLASISGQILASSNAGNTLTVPELPGEDVLLQLKQGNNYVGLDPLRDRGLHIRAVVTAPGGSPFLLQALYPIPDRISNLALGVELAQQQYRELSYLRNALKQSFTLTLSLVLLFSLLSAIWAAFFSARRLTAPIGDLVAGTRAVADGDYNQRLPLSSNDELGFLVKSFNAMTRRVARSQRQLEDQRTYLEAVLGSLSSGVLSLDSEGRLRTSNPVAARILGCDLDSVHELPFSEIAKRQPHLAGFTDMVCRHQKETPESWEEELTLFGATGRQILLCRGTPLASSRGQQRGHVVVFDDITTLIQAQRDAAWGEAARRMAHEIKNPLTPIRLSAERLRHKYLHTLPESDARVLDRSTNTIIAQVETMKAMVNAFSDYARPPKMAPEPVDVVALVEEVVDLYRNNAVSAEIELDLSPGTPQILADRGRLRQVIHNLITNALEAMHDSPERRLTITCRCGAETPCSSVIMEFGDTGPGFPENIRGQLFEPYVTTKPKGTGLGLAIVKKIVEEHGGIIQPEATKSGGGLVRLRLPVENRTLLVSSPAESPLLAAEKN
ncbi:MAG: HAMP domain-containing protein [Chromatiales bacterium]|nr:HAMP domain-containing protein [Chromatiales bacterium]